MQHISMTAFGRAPTDADRVAVARHRTPVPDGTRDRWAILRDLTTARARFGLSDRALTVLAALVSFHPDANLRAGGGVVFPSNATLSARAHGMAESTLRRHLAALVEAGMIQRRDSPNGKRYARRGAGDAPSVAYGFDLSPLLRRDAEIRQAAETVRAETERLRALRERVVLMLRDATGLVALADPRETAPWDAERDRLALIRRTLRRKLDETTLTAMAAEMETLLSTIDARLPAVETPEPSGCDARNERHIQESEKISSDMKPMKTLRTQSLTLAQAVAACPELKEFSPAPVRDWPDLCRTMGTLRPMLGIDAALWSETEREMGEIGAAITLAGVLQRMGTIRNPGGYLRDLTRKAREGRFSPVPMIEALARDTTGLTAVG